MSEDSFGEKLKKLRKRIKKSQAEVAEEITALSGGKISISQTTLSMLEQRATPPREDIIRIISEYYKVPITFFIEKSNMHAVSDRRGIEEAKKYLLSLGDRTFADKQEVAHSFPTEDEEF